MIDLSLLASACEWLGVEASCYDGALYFLAPGDLPKANERVDRTEPLGLDS